MRKKFASLAMLFGMLAAVMLGSTSMAHAQTTSNFVCDPVGVVPIVSVTCNNVVTGDVVTIVTDDILSQNDIDVLRNFLNDPDVVDADVLNNAVNNNDISILNNALQNFLNDNNILNDLTILGVVLNDGSCVGVCVNL